MLLKGSFYCLFRSGQLVAFKVADESWELLADSKPSENATLLRYCRYRQLAECDGDILLVPYVCAYRSARGCGCSVWKYEWAERGVGGR